MSRGGAEREADTESEGSMLWAVSTEPDASSKPPTVKSLPEPPDPTLDT